MAVSALNPDRADAGSIESPGALKPIADEQAGTVSREVERGTAIAGALASIEQCLLRYRDVRDYTCTFSKRERIKGQRTPLQVLVMKVQTQPMAFTSSSVSLPPARSHLCRRANSGKVLAHDVGLNKLLAGTLRLEPTGGLRHGGLSPPDLRGRHRPVARYPETRWSSELVPSESVVVFRDQQTVGTRPCTMIEATHPHRQPEFMFHRVRVFIDDELGLPIRFEAYDWPSSPHAPAEMVEEYTYSDLHLNVGLSDLDFNVSNGDYAFGRF